MYGAAEIEFLANKGDLDFTREYNLGKEPLRVDLLVGILNLHSQASQNLKQLSGIYFPKNGYRQFL